MQIFRSIDHVFPSECVVALGCFDGVHKGHAAVLGEAKKISVQKNIPLCVFSFSEPPRNFFCEGSVPLITSESEKLRLLADMGTDVAVCVPFDKNILSMTAEDFINIILLNRLRAAHVVCGYNYTFGKGALGTPELIGKLCKTRGVGVTVTPDLCVNGISVSSSEIRRRVAEGDMDTAAMLLGRNYSLSGKVVDGQHLARRLGFPTVNIIPSQNLLIPKNGVYVSAVRFDNERKYGITNVGLRPTVNTHILCAETHLFDFDGDLYGKSITVEFLRFMREETKFPSVEQMAIQIENDILEAKKYLQSMD